LTTPIPCQISRHFSRQSGEETSTWAENKSPDFSLQPLRLIHHRLRKPVSVGRSNRFAALRFSGQDTMGLLMPKI
jgi:hypothetical protein